MSNHVRSPARPLPTNFCQGPKKRAYCAMTIPFFADAALGADLALTDIHSYQFVVPLSQRTK